MQLIEIKAWIEPNLEGIPPYMNHNPEISGYINEIFALNGVAPKHPYGSKITYLQYTTLNDSKGNKIFNRDIVEWESAPGFKRRGIVRFEDGSYVVDVYGAKVYLAQVVRLGCVVVGNELEENA